MTTGFELVVAWYVVVALQATPVTIGPFSNESQCGTMRQWLARTAAYSKVSECFYGPAISISKGPK